MWQKVLPQQHSKRDPQQQKQQKQHDDDDDDDDEYNHVGVDSSASELGPRGGKKHKMARQQQQPGQQGHKQKDPVQLQVQHPERAEEDGSADNTVVEAE
jgi:hypothetical protein